MKLNLSKEELETMNYDDIAYHILKEEETKMKISDLFQKVCEVLNLNKDEYEDKIADFFELLTTNKRFIMLEDGFWDLRERHNPKLIVDEDEDEGISPEVDDDENIENEEENEDEDIFYDSDTDDDIPDDELDDLVIIDDEDEEANS